MRQNLVLGLGGLMYHKLRTLLTMLGVIFGVAAVVAMLSIGEGARQEAMKKYEMLGVNNIIIREPPMSQQEVEEARASFSRGLSISDARALKSIIPAIEVSAPQRELELEVKYRDLSIQAAVVGTVTEYQQLLNYYVDRGSFFNRDQYSRSQKVCVLGAEAKRKLFPLREAVGEMVKMGDQWLRVIGVMERKGHYIQSSGVVSFRDLDQDIYIPLSTSLDRLETDPVFVRQSRRRGAVYEHSSLDSEIQQITVKVADSGELMETANVIKRILHRRHHKQNDFTILIPEELLAQEQKDKRIFDIVLACIAGISLLVGGIGIMNIMLASVLERTREIGVRRAVGAARADILGQFIVEASLISLLGGLLGIFLGFAMAFIIDYLADFSAVVSLWSIAIAFGVSTMVGLIFGIYPAKRAAELNPIDALRYE